MSVVFSASKKDQHFQQEGQTEFKKKKNTVFFELLTAACYGQRFPNLGLISEISLMSVKNTNYYIGLRLNHL